MSAGGTALDFAQLPPDAITANDAHVASLCVTVIYFFVIFVAWPTALWLLTSKLLRQAPSKPAAIAWKPMLNLAAQVIAADGLALLLAAIPRAVLEPGSVGRALMLLTVAAAASVWNGDCLYRIYALKSSLGKEAKRKLSVLFGIFSNPFWMLLLLFTGDWLLNAGPGISRAEFELFSIQLIIGPLIILVLCPRDRRGALLDGLALLRLLLLTAMAPVAAIEGHIIAHFLDLPMSSPLFIAVWGLSSGVIMEECFRGLYAHFLYDDRSVQSRISLLFGALANPIWPVILFGLQGMRF